MPWVKLDDKYAEHPKIAQAGPLAELLWIRSIAYCNRNLTNGFIPYSVARTLVSWRYTEAPDGEGRERVVDVAITSGLSGEDLDCEMFWPALVAAGLWEERPGGFMVHDYLDYQPSKADVEAEKAAARERMARGRAAKKGVRGEPVENFAGSSAEVQANIAGSSPYPVPDPVESIPSRKKDEKKNGVESVNGGAYPAGDVDVLDTYYRLTGSRPWGKKVGDWLLELQATHGLANVDAALEVESKTGLPKLVDRVAARLERQAARVEQERARPKPRTLSPEDEAFKAALVSTGRYEPPVSRGMTKLGDVVGSMADGSASQSTSPVSAEGRRSDPAAGVVEANSFAPSSGPPPERSRPTSPDGQGSKETT